MEEKRSQMPEQIRPSKVGIREVSNQFKKKPSPSLYFSCRFCTVAIASISRIREHVQKKHNISLVTTEHYVPSFKKMFVQEDEGAERSSSFEFACNFCENIYFSKDDVAFHIKNSHYKHLA